MPDARVDLEQPTGGSFEAVPFGDEWYNGYETGAGFTVLRDRRTRAWEYAEKGPGGTLVPSGLRPGRDRPSGVTRHLRDVTEAEERPDDSQPPGGGAPPLGGGFPGELLDPSGPSKAPNPTNEGTQRSLVILVQFANRASLGTTPAQWSTRFFGPTESVADFWNKSSYGRLAIGPSLETHGTANDGVVGWLTLPSNHPNTQGNTGAGNQALTRDAIQAANPFVNFAAYDTNGNGQLSGNELHITVIPAGYEAASGCPTPSVWGHKYGAGGYTPNVDGVWAGVEYTQFGEVHCGSGRPNRMATLGIIAHEIGHDLDLPDLYDVDGQAGQAGGSSGGVGSWSVMAYGTWLNLANTDPGTSPSYPDAFSRVYQGWVTPRQVVGSSVNALAQSATDASIVQLRDNPNGVDWEFGVKSGTGEYFLVENRQRVGYDRALPGCGVLVWHVDETRTSGKANADETRRLVDLEEADGEADSPFDAADAYTGNRVFDSASNPNSRLYGGGASGVSASDFDPACSANMSARFSDGAAAPVNDAFAGSSTIANLPYTRAGLDTASATTEVGEPTPACAPAGKTVWFRYTPAVNMRVAADTVGSDFDTVLAAYRGNAVNALTALGCNDDIDHAAGNDRSGVELDLTAGQTYYFQTGGYRNAANEPASGSLTLNVAQLAGPALACHGSQATVAGLTGTAGDDVIVGTAGDDTINGMGGNDKLCGGDGFDTMSGGPGNDTIDGEAGNDRVDYGLAAGGVNVDLGVGQATGEGSDALHSISQASGSPQADALRGSDTNGESIEVLVGGAGVDDLKGGAGDDRLDGDAANDTLTGGPGVDTLNGNAGADTIAARDNEADSISCGADVDPVATIDPADSHVECEQVDDGAAPDPPANDAFASATTIAGLPYLSPAFDTVGATTEAGEPLPACAPVGKTAWLRYTPTVDMRVRANTVGSDFDTVLAVYSGTALNALTPVGCNDDIDHAADNRRSQVELDLLADETYYFQAGGYKDGPNPPASGSLGLDLVQLAGAEPTCHGSEATVAGLTGTAGDDVIIGTSDSETIDGQGGNDKLCGGGGFDTVNGGPGNDTIDGQGGGDGAEYGFSAGGVDVNLLTGQATGDGTDTLHSISEVYGSPHGDTLRGSDSNGTSLEFLAGGAGADSLNGGTGTDRLDGGGDNDTLTGGTGLDTLNGNAGADTIAARDTQVDAVNCGADADPVATIDPTDVLAECEATDDGGAAPVCRGSEVTVSGLVGTAGDDVILGTAGEDVIDGLGGNDKLCGGDGFDTIRGGSGNDTIDGQGGGDGLDYGLAPAGVNVNLETGLATGEGTDALFSISEVYGSPHADSLRGSDSNGATLEFLAGVGGNDDLNGGAGNDRLDGGGGNDGLVGGTGLDALNGDAGADSLAARDGQADSVNCGGDLDPVAAIDAGDSRAECEQVDDGVDRTAPETSIDAGPSGTVASRDARMDFHASEAARFECSLDGAPFGACASPAVYGGLGEGGHRFAVRAIDTAGNVDPTPAELGWTVDLPIPPPLFSCSVGSSGSRLAKALQRGVLVSFTCTEAARMTLRLTLARTTAYRLGLAKSRTGGPVTVATARATGRSGNLRLRFSARRRRALARPRKVTFQLRTTATSTTTGRKDIQRLKLTLRR